ncbi:MAG: hypothetical protein KC478_10105 [Bacteriovoracaceae bacterium]|nr:hypothetical protein [Bacteriovoracaceae bacterium]
MKFLILLALSVFMLTSCSSNSKKELTPAEKKAKLYYNQGTRNLVAKDYTEALKNLMEAAALDSKNSQIHNNLGMAYWFKKSSKRAVWHIKKSIELDPKNTDAKLNLASIYLEKKSFSKAQDLYENILEDLTYEGQHRTHYNLGIIALAKGQANKAYAKFKLALDINPSYCPAHYKMGEMSFKNGHYLKAYESYREAGMGMCYSNPEPLLGQIDSLIKLGRYSEALVKLADMQERFAMSKYEVIARKTIRRVKALQAKEDRSDQVYSQQMEAPVRSLDF